MTDTERDVILAFAENNMHSRATADMLHYHRNTIEYHLSKIKRVYNLDPKNFYDLVELVRLAKGGVNP